ncbi:hypothetical protein EUGRSUZ_L02723 [Eucalyptus grandis]|uniref:Uncharacterized protein n=1 Tax=Eucalyptus grandis TaxID=71139 RepID=A0AAD9WHQ0_EUCGR|nr:hypothetical protein EUGRSUZ_L02723 [Eucalyptus grandis]
MGRTGDDSLLCLVFNMALSELVVCWDVIIYLWILVQYYLRWREMTIRGNFRCLKSSLVFWLVRQSRQTICTLDFAI